MFHRFTLAVTVLVLAACTSTLLAQDGKDAPKQPAKPPTAAELLKLAGPGPEHEKMAKYAGKWDIMIKMGGTASYKGEAENRMTVAGRFLQMDFKAKAAKEIPGLPADTEGAFTLGFDRRHGHYALIHMDTFGTYFVTSQGKADETTGKIRMAGKDDDPMMKAMGLTKEFVHVVDFKSADEFVVEVLIIDTRTPARKEMKFMEYAFARKK